VITLGDLINAEVDDIFHIAGLKDLQALCKCRADPCYPTGAGLLGFGIPPAKSEKGSPHSQEWLFSQENLNNKNIVVFTVASLLLDLELEIVLCCWRLYMFLILCFMLPLVCVGGTRKGGT